MSIDQMVESQIEARGVTNPRVLKAMRKVRRADFVRPDLMGLSEEDRPLDIGHGQTISQPYIVAYMTEALELKDSDRVLEIGTGCGYQTAILAELASEVYSIETVNALAKESQKRLAELGYTNVHLRHGNGYLGWPEKAPFDKIILTAAPPEMPPALIEQLAPNGRLVGPVGDLSQELVCLNKDDQGHISENRLLGVRFVPMVNDTD